MTNPTPAPASLRAEPDDPSEPTGSPGAALLVATSDGVRSDDRAVALAGRHVSALAAADDGTLWAIVDGTELHHLTADPASPGRGFVAALPGDSGSLLVVHGDQVYVAGDRATLWKLEGDALARVTSFDEAPSHPNWYTPWGGPPSIMSMATSNADMYVGVHVGGIIRSSDGGATWSPTIDLELDVHQVVADPATGTLYAATGMGGLAVSSDRGASWQLHDDGLHARYLLAVATTAAGVLVGASSGPRATDGAVYLFDGARFEQVDGLGDRLEGAVGPRRIVGRGRDAALIDPGGSVFVSGDGGRRWGPAPGSYSRPTDLVLMG